MAENVGNCASAEAQTGFGPGQLPDRLPGLTHQLANLVQAVSGNLELLAGRTVDETSLRYLANAHAAAQHLVELTMGLQAEHPSGLSDQV